MPIFSPEQLKRFSEQVSATRNTENTEGADTTIPASFEQPSGLGMGYKAGLIGSNVFDAMSTNRALNQGAHESNPLMQQISKSEPGMIAAKAGIGLLEAYTFDKLAKSHPKLARALAIAGIAVPTAAGTRNLTR